MKKLLGIALVIGLFASPAGAAKGAKPLVVMEDASGDVGPDASGPVPGLENTGADLIKAELGKAGSNLEFKVTHSSMPSTGSFPEAARFMWHFTVDTKGLWRITVKSVDIGKPDLIAMSGTERVGQVETAGHFRLEQCAEDPTLPIVLINCHTVEKLEGTFDVASASFTAVIPLKSIKAKPGSKISGGTHWSASSGCQICWVLHLAERSLTATTIIDAAAQAKTYVVPK